MNDSFSRLLEAHNKMNVVWAKIMLNSRQNPESRAKELELELKKTIYEYQSALQVWLLQI